jgi:endoglycosylceramidase
LITTFAVLAALHVEGGFFRDDQHAAVILRGVNVAGDSKVPPFRPAADGAIFDPLPRWGLDAVRLLFTWEAYEPDAGAYDQTYLDYYVGAVRAAAARGLYVIVDFHQDGFSRYLVNGCGEGFPAWAIPPEVARATPDNGAACANWGRDVLSDDGLAATWNAFYSDAHGARTRYLMMIERVAGALAGEANVVGYDLLNEPAGDEPTQLAPLYEDAAKAVRRAHPTAVVFVSPGMLTSGGPKTQLPPPTFGNLAYAPHFYDPGVYLYHGWGGSDERDTFTQMRAKADEWGAALLVGEYGGPPDLDQGPDYEDTLAARLDDELASGTQWAYTPGWTAARKDGWNNEDFSIVDGAGKLRANFHPRPSARRVAGTPTALTVDRQGLRLDWTHDPAAGATELYVPAALGLDAIAATGASCTRAGELVTCRATTAGAKSLRVTKDSSKCGLTGAEALLLVGLWRCLLRALNL